MALKERINYGYENLTENSGIVLRIEDILEGKSFDKMKKISDDLVSYYIEILRDRIIDLNRELKELPDPFTDISYLDYLEILELLKKEPEDLSLGEKEKIFRLYSDGINYNYGPHISFSHKIFFEEDYVLEDALKDMDILRGIMVRIPDVIELPAREKLQREITMLQSYLKQLKGYDNNINCFAVNREIFLNNYTKIRSILRKLKTAGEKIELVIDDDGSIVKENNHKSGVPYSYTAEQMELFEKLYNEDLVSDIYFSEFFQEKFIPTSKESLWSYEYVYEANFDKNNIARIIKNANLTPFESILEANRQISKSKYSGVATNSEKTRTFLTAGDATFLSPREMGNKAFVCTGYASYAKAIIDELNNPNIRATLVPMDFYYKKTNRKKYSATHLVVLVEIEDEQYGINGAYIWDPTWSTYGIDFVLSPISDLKKFKKIYTQIDHKQHSKISKFLKSPREDVAKENSVKNSVYDEYKNLSNPIKIQIYRAALNGMFDKLRELDYCPDREILYKNNNELINKLFSQTAGGLTMLDPETADNDFYKTMRDYYLKHEHLYPNWADNWLKYNENHKLK